MRRSTITRLVVGSALALVSGTTAGTALAGKPRSPSRGALPFTGLPLWIAAIVAVALLAAGFALRAARERR